MSYSLICCSVGSLKEAKKIAQILLQQKLAACVQIQEVKSHFIWENEIQVEKEQLLFIKSKTEHYLGIEKSIIENHSYKIPEIIQIPINKGYQPYLNWINQVVS